MCFLCVLFKTDGRFTLAEMGDKQLRKDGGNRRDTKRETPPSLHRHGTDAFCEHPLFSHSVLFWPEFLQLQLCYSSML